MGSLEFGLSKGAHNNKLDSLWEDACFAGYRSQSGETMVSTSRGVFRTRTIRRVPESMRLGRKILEEFIFVPWKANASADEARHTMLDEVPPVPSDQSEVSMEPPAVAAVADTPRKLYMKTDDVQKHGYTPGCSGCNAIRMRKTRCTSRRHYSYRTNRRSNEPAIDSNWN